MSTGHTFEQELTMSVQPPFNVRALFTWKSDRLYRVYQANGNLYFIRIGGQGGMEYILGHPFGIIGALLVGGALGLLRKRTEERLDQIDLTDPE